MGRKEGGRTRACKDDDCWPSTSGGIKTPGPSEAGRVSNGGFRLDETHWRCRHARSTRTAGQSCLRSQLHLAASFVALVRGRTEDGCCQQKTATRE